MEDMNCLAASIALIYRRGIPHQRRPEEVGINASVGRKCLRITISVYLTSN